MKSSHAPSRLAVLGLVSSIALSLGLAAPAVQANEPVLGKTLDGLIEYARTHNPDMLAARLDAAAARERITPAAALPDPRFEIELMDFTNTMNPDRSASLLPGEVGATRYRIVQMLPFPGKRDLRGEIAERRADQRDTAAISARLAVESGIKSAYARYYQAAGQTAILRETVSLVESLEHLVLTRYGLGLIPQQDAVRVQSELTSLKVDMVESERRRREASAKLNAMLPRAADAPLAQPESLPPLPDQLSLATLVEQATAQSPEIDRERIGATAAERSRELVHLDRYPDFGIALSNNRPRGGRASWDLMLELNIPLQQAARRAREREAGYLVDYALTRTAAATARLSGRLGEMHAAVAANRDKSRLLRDTLLAQAEATLEAARAGYESGKVNFNTLIEAERQILRTRLALLNAEVETRIGIAEIEQLVGAPL